MHTYMISIVIKNLHVRELVDTIALLLYSLFHFNYFANN